MILELNIEVSVDIARIKNGVRLQFLNVSLYGNISLTPIIDYCAMEISV
jgi:hypothetical protein